jgi:hypothetical protein
MRVETAVLSSLLLRPLPIFEEHMRHLERITYIALLVTCLIASAVLVRNNFFARGSATSGPKIGARVAIPSLSWAPPDTYVVLALSSRCRFCLESVPFYQSLSSWKERKHADLKLVVVSAEPTGVTETFLRSNRITVDAVVSYPLQNLGISGTPTLMIVDSGGILRAVHDGKLEPNDQAEVIARLEKPL